MVSAWGRVSSAVWGPACSEWLPRTRSGVGTVFQRISGASSQKVHRCFVYQQHTIRTLFSDCCETRLDLKGTNAAHDGIRIGDRPGGGLLCGSLWRVVDTGRVCVKTPPTWGSRFSSPANYCVETLAAGWGVQCRTAGSRS